MIKFKKSVLLFLNLESILRQLLFSGWIIITIFIISCHKDADNSIVNPSMTIETITGKVVDYNGKGLGNIKVENNQGTVRTGADGSFTINNVVIPYEINLYANSYTKVETYKNLTTTKPVFTIDDQNTNMSKFTDITVIIPQYNNNQRALATFYNDSGFYKSDVNFYSNNYVELTHYWNGNNVISGKVTIWVYTSDNQGNITSYDKYGEKPLTITNGISARIVFNDIDLNTNPSDSVISGSVNIPNADYIQYSIIGMNRVPFGNLYSYGDIDWKVTTNNLYFSSFVPVLSGNVYKYYIYLNVIKNEQRGGGTIVAEITPGGSNVITFNTSPALLTPSDNDQNVNYDTEFSFTNDYPQGVYKLVFFYYGYNSNNIVRSIYLNTNNSKLPVLSDTSYNLADNTTGEWYVIKYIGFKNVDEFVNMPLFINPKHKEVVYSEGRNFKTKLTNK